MSASRDMPHTTAKESSEKQADTASASTETTSATLRLAESMIYISENLTSGSPSTYKLHMREDMRRADNMVARQSIGKPSRNGRGATEKVLLVLGALGAGKTTLINGMVNYILGVEWKDDFRFKLITEEDKEQQAPGITVYTFHPMRGSAVPYTFTIIDTPGFVPTDGLKRNEKIIRQIKEFFSIPPPDGIDHLDGIGFVVQASQQRPTSKERYIIDSVLSIFGNEVSRNLFMMITFADGQRPTVLDAVKEANIPNLSKKHFKFNNSTLFAENKDSEMCLTQMFWDIGFRFFQDFFLEFENFENKESVSLSHSREVLREREKSRLLAEGLNFQITLGMSKIEEMRQEESVLKQRGSEIEANKDFTYNVDVTKDVREDQSGAGRHATTCITCNMTCHDDCKILDDGGKYNCWAMNQDGLSSKCRICPQNCTWSEHKNRPYVIRYEMVTETRTADDLQRKYHRGVQGKATSQEMMKSLEKDLNDVHNKVRAQIDKAHENLRRLDEIALKPNPITKVEYLEMLIESEKRGAKHGWQERIKYLEAAKSGTKMSFKTKDENEDQKL